MQGSLSLRRFGGLAAVTAVVLMLAGASGAGVNEWSSAGPYGGQITGLAVDPTDTSTVYVSTQGGGVFKSEDFGATWETRNEGIGYLGLTAFALASFHPETLYTSSALSGTFRSDDEGDTWVSANEGLPSAQQIAEFAVDPSDEKIVYAATPVGVYKTTTGGGSLDGTDDWTVVGNAGSGLTFQDISALAINPTTPTTLYAAGNPTAGNRGIFKSVDGGTSWTPANGTGAGETPGPTGYIHMLAIDPQAPNTVYAAAGSVQGLWKTTDGGSNWSQLTPGAGPVGIPNAVAVDPETSTTLYLGTSTGFHRSTNGGTNWTQAGGVPSTGAQIAIDPTGAPNTLYVGTLAAGVRKSINDGASFAAANTGIAALGVAALDIHPNDPLVAYAGVSGIGSGLFMTDDGGATWDPTCFTTGVSAVAGDPSNLNRILIGVGNGVWVTPGVSGCNDPTSGITAGVLAIEFDPADPDVVYAGTISAGIYRSEDRGLNWTQVGFDDLPTPSSRLVRLIAFNPTNTDTLYIATNAGLYKSVDGGDNWTPMDEDVNAGAITALAVDPSNANTVYAARDGFVVNGGVFKSVDAGDTWDPLTPGAQLASTQYSGIVVDPNDPTTIYLSTSSGHGVYRYANDTDGWVPFDEGLTNTIVRTMVGDPIKGARLYLGTNGSSAFTRLVDLSPPTNPVISPSHPTGGWSNDPTIEIELSGATDDGSGVDGFDTAWNTSGTTSLNPAVKDTEEFENFLISPTLVDGANHWFHLRTLDNIGQASEVEHRGPFMIDTTPPTGVALTGAALRRSFQLSRSFPVRWTGTDATSGIQSFALQRRVVPGAFAPFTTPSGTGPATITGLPGQTVCLRVTALDEVSNATTSADRCTALPKNNTQLRHRGAWQKKTGAGYYESSYSETTQKGARLQTSFADATALALVVTKCRGCGTLEVFWKGVKVKTIRLAAATTKKKQLVVVRPATAPAEDGQLRIVVKSSGKPVRVEGAGALRAG